MTALTRELLLQNIVQLRRIGLALACLHREADEEAEQLVLAAAVFRDLVCVGRDDLVHQRLDGAAVGDLLESLGFDESIDAFGYLFKRITDD